jgi:hypothetical protein
VHSDRNLLLRFSSFCSGLTRPTLLGFSSQRSLRSPRTLRYLFFLAALLNPPYFIQIMIQNPTPVLTNHASSVILNAFENARKASTLVLQIIATS